VGDIKATIDGDEFALEANAANIIENAHQIQPKQGLVESRTKVGQTN